MVHRLRYTSWALALLTACSTASVTPSSGSLEGSWRITFWAPPGTHPQVDSVVGVLEFHRLRASDSSVVAAFPMMYRDSLVGSVQVDFTPILGRQISCLTADGLPPTARYHTPDSISVAFTPGGVDCGLWADGRLSDSGVTGSWIEPGFAGASPPARFRMVRR